MHGAEEKFHLHFLVEPERDKLVNVPVELRILLKQILMK